ncbi:Nn.00g084480.m01.CDS01 [Neocucurbitaria sp. VM-36]
MVIRSQKKYSQRALEDYPSEEIAYFEAREALMKSSLVTRNKESTVLRVHRLVQDAVRSNLDLSLFRDVFNAATVLNSAVWPFIDNENLNEIDRLRKVQRYQTQVSRLRSVLEGRGVETVKPSLAIAALFNESSWTYQLQETGYGFSLGDEYAVLAQQIAEINDDKQDDEIRSKVLADSYRVQGIIGSYLDTDKGVPCTKRWIELLVSRITKYQHKDDIDTLPIAYNEYGWALMRVPDEQEALRSWELASATIRELTKAREELPFPYPWFHRALIYSFNGQPDRAETIIMPILEEREKKLGKDDTGTYETGMILTCIGHVFRAQGKKDESYSFNQRAEAVVPVTTGERSLASLTAYYRLACDEFDRERFKEARQLLEKVVSFVGEDAWFKAIAARGNSKLGRTLLREGGDDNEDEARIVLDRAMSLRHELVSDDDREEEDLTDDDWDSLVFYLFR